MTPTQPTLTVNWDRVNQLRTPLGLTSDYALAKAMGVNKSTVSRVKSGEGRPGAKFIAALPQALNTTHDDVFTTPNEQAA